MDKAPLAAFGLQPRRTARQAIRNEFIAKQVFNGLLMYIKNDDNFDNVYRFISLIDILLSLEHDLSIVLDDEMAYGDKQAYKRYFIDGIMHITKLDIWDDSPACFSTIANEWNKYFSIVKKLNERISAQVQNPDIPDDSTRQEHVHEFARLFKGQSQDAVDTILPTHVQIDDAQRPFVEAYMQTFAYLVEQEM